MPIKVASFRGKNHDVNFGGDMVIKSLRKFRRCLDLFGICNSNYSIGPLLEVIEKFHFVRF